MWFQEVLRENSFRKAVYLVAVKPGHVHVFYRKTALVTLCVQSISDIYKIYRVFIQPRLQFSGPGRPDMKVIGERQ